MNIPAAHRAKPTAVPIVVRIGIWVWGSATALLAVATLIFLISASIYIQGPEKFSTAAPKWMPGVHLVLKDHNQLVAAILAVSTRTPRPRT
jgi:hypothetical protein